MGSITNAGYEPVALADWISRFETLFRRVYGSDIDLSAKSADGQMVGILAQMFADQDEQVATGFAMLDPNQASGTWVDQFLAYLALRRKSAQTTQLTIVKIEGTRDTIIRPPYIVVSKSGVKFQLNSTVAIGDDGTVQTSFSSVEQGEFKVLAGDVLTPETIVLGVTKVINMQVSSGGAGVELDADAVDRAVNSYGITAQNTVDGTVAEIRQMDDVIACNGYENEEATVDANGQPANSQWIIVDGGTPANIAKAIMTRKPPGVKQVGSQQYGWTDATGKERIAKWDQPTYVEPYISIVVARKELFTDVSEDFIKRTLAAQTFNIGEEVSAFELGTLLQENQNFYIKQFLIGRTQSAITDTILDIGIKERAIINSDNISVAVVNVNG
jgi:uncharacterized phage protein gp47/JayE